MLVYFFIFMTEELATLYFSKTAPVAKFSVGNGTIIVLTFSMVEIIEKTGEVLDFPMKLISSWGFALNFYISLFSYKFFL